MQLTLWDLVKPVIELFRQPERPQPENSVQRKPRNKHPKPAPAKKNLVLAHEAPSSPPAKKLSVEPLSQARGGSSAKNDAETMDERYERVTREMLSRYGVKVRKWRTAMSGVAWELQYRDGSVKRLIESPRPRGPMSAAVFLHEIGHHAIGFNRYKPRCLEEYHAWAWSLAAMEEHGLNITDAVRRRMHESLWYAVSKAQRRGIKELPPELMAFTERPPRKRKKSPAPVEIAQAQSRRR